MRMVMKRVALQTIMKYCRHIGAKADAKTGGRSAGAGRGRGGCPQPWRTGGPYAGASTTGSATNEALDACLGSSCTWARALMLALGLWLGEDAGD